MAKRRKKTHDIDDTALAPYVIADGVVGAVAKCFGQKYGTRADANRIAIDHYRARRGLQRDLSHAIKVCVWVHRNDGQLSRSRWEEAELTSATKEQARI